MRHVKHRKYKPTNKGGFNFGVHRALKLAKGITSESSVMNALATVKPGWYISARKANPVEDHNGIDIIIKIRRGDHVGEIPVQVKSSARGVQEHFEHRARFNGEYVPCIIVEQDDTDTSICKTLEKKVINKYFHFVKQWRKKQKTT